MAVSYLVQFNASPRLWKQALSVLKIFRSILLCAGVVTAVSFITVCVVAVVTRLLYRRQVQRGDPGSHKDKQQRSTEEPAFRTELHLHHAMRDSIKEYYI
uniref:Uncharacterized protein n=1 Tax=Periophthalmus magnuspinnatus TaxID=409849 RepID=A0A3B3ZQL9_9GOBI